MAVLANLLERKTVQQKVIDLVKSNYKGLDVRILTDVQGIPGWVYEMHSHVRGKYIVGSINAEPKAQLKMWRSSNLPEHLQTFLDKHTKALHAKKT